MIFLEIPVSLFDAVLCVYFISRFNCASFSRKKNPIALVAILVIFAFSVINDLFLAGFNVIGTIIFLALYIGYALLISEKKYARAIFSACLFEVIFILLSSLLYLVMSSMIDDYDSLIQGSNGIFRCIFLIMHKIILFVALYLILWRINVGAAIDRSSTVIALLFSLATVLGLGAAMFTVAEAEDGKIRMQATVITVVLAFANLALYLLIFQMQKYQKNKYELEILQEKISFEESRHSDASTIWSSIRRTQHDMKQHIAVISGYLDSGRIDECRSYLQELEPAITSFGNLITSNNAVLDYLINSKLTPLSDTQIVISGSIGDLSDIKEIDLACLIGNILDNAIEALGNIKKAGEKRLELLFMRQNSNRIIICKNTIDHSVLNRNGELKSTKLFADSHGYGTKIIAKIASDYNGMVDYFEEFGMFGVQVVLPEP